MVLNNFVKGEKYDLFIIQINEKTEEKIIKECHLHLFIKSVVKINEHLKFKGEIFDEVIDITKKLISEEFQDLNFTKPINDGVVSFRDNNGERISRMLWIFTQ